MNEYSKQISDAIINNTQIEKYNLCGKQILLESVVDMDFILEAVDNEEFNKDERLPYWAHLWPSSFALAEYLSFPLRRYACSRGMTARVDWAKEPHPENPLY